MTIDFGKLSGNNSMDTVLPPREIFSVLPEKHDRYDYPRDVQAEVMNKWFDARNQKDIVIKMNTGSGKTLVGLLLLKSCLNEKKGPAVYVVPDPYLVNQVIKEARDLGIDVTDNPRSLSFRKGESILVINIYKLINGKSVFEVDSPEISVGSIIIDDAHACLDTTEMQFTVNIPVSLKLYSQLFKLFQEKLKQQSEVGFIELENLDPNANMRVPYWGWKEKITEVTQLLFANKESEDDDLRSLKFG